MARDTAAVFLLPDAPAYEVEDQRSEWPYKKHEHPAGISQRSILRPKHLKEHHSAARKASNDCRAAEDGNGQTYYDWNHHHRERGSGVLS